MDVKLWLSNNWDKLLGFFLSIALAGVVGFFSAVRATDSQVSELRGKIVALETDANNLIKPRITSIDSNKLEIERLIKKIEFIEQENDILFNAPRLIHRYIMFLDPSTFHFGFHLLNVK